jgi:hypothetical protein
VTAHEAHVGAVSVGRGRHADHCRRMREAKVVRRASHWLKYRLPIVCSKVGIALGRTERTSVLMVIKRLTHMLSLLLIFVYVGMGLANVKAVDQWIINSTVLS